MLFFDGDLVAFSNGDRILFVGSSQYFDRIEEGFRVTDSFSLASFLERYIDTPFELDQLSALWNWRVLGHRMMFTQFDIVSKTEMIHDICLGFQSGAISAIEAADFQCYVEYGIGKLMFQAFEEGVIPHISVTTEDLMTLCPEADRSIVAAIVDQAYDVLTPLGVNANVWRVRHFFAQCAVETGYFTKLVESLYYRTVDRLTEVFPKYFKPHTAVDPKDYLRNSKKVANYVYANRMLNGNTASGDGYKFRGRGLIHLTGRENYRKVGAHARLGLEGNPDMVADLKFALQTAAGFWDLYKINPVADKGTVTQVTKIVNGGKKGLAEREKRYEAAARIWPDHRGYSRLRKAPPYLGPGGLGWQISP